MGLVKVKYCIVWSIISNKINHIQYNNQTINIKTDGKGRSRSTNSASEFCTIVSWLEFNTSYQTPPAYRCNGACSEGKVVNATSVTPTNIYI
jgi:hypothetical protein